MAGSAASWSPGVVGSWKREKGRSGVGEVEAGGAYVAEIDAAVRADPKRALRLGDLLAAAATTVSLAEMRAVCAEMAALQREGLAELNARRAATGLPPLKAQPPQV